MVNRPEWNTPITNQLLQFTSNGPTSFHVPGHRNGMVYRMLHKEDTLSAQMEQHLRMLSQIAQLDITELSHTDDLHDPQGMIAEAQQLAARLYQSEHSFFLVGGSTAGNLALILSICETDDIIIVQRNVHKSVINGCKLAGARVVFVQAELEPHTELSVIPSLTTIAKALQQYPEAKAVFLTNPNYYGLSADLTPYVELVHRYHIPLLVDEAHGAHYGFAPHSPPSALTSGADGVVQSAHKTLPALTMGAMLHIQGPYLDKERLQQQLAIVQSSSPSYLIMSSLDLARATLEHYGEQWFGQTYALREHLIYWISEHTRFAIAELPDSSDYRQDPYRLLLYDTTHALSGYALQQRLEDNGVWVEMATTRYAVLILHMALTEEELIKVKHALEKINEEKLSAAQPALNYSVNTYSSDGQLAVSTPVAFSRISPGSRSTEVVSLQLAIGKRCAELVVPYPPGIPLLYEGEWITAAHIDELQRYIVAGAKFQGNHSLNELKLKVYLLNE